MQPQRIWLSVIANFASVRLAAAGLRGVLAELGCGEDQAATIELCTVEAMNNVVEHAYVETAPGRVELCITRLGDAVEIVVSDTGRPMPDGLLAGARLPSAADEPREGGYGLGLIRELMTDVTYQRVADVNTLTMKAPL